MVGLATLSMVRCANPFAMGCKVIGNSRPLSVFLVGVTCSMFLFPTRVVAQTTITLASNVTSEGKCDGILLSYWATEGETDVPMFIVYALVMGYIFGGVAVAADAFMGSIEAITAETKEVTLGAGQYERVVHVEVWNKTVSNLSLMALGSSAPEILLAVIEVIGNDFSSGALGPGTIVGSAAFNMLMIIAICMGIEPIKRVEAILVLYITAAASAGAYIWLYAIVDLISPGKIEIWEAAVTIAMFPVMLLIAFAADKGWLDSDICWHKAKNARRSLAGLDLVARHEQLAIQHLVAVNQVPVHAQGTSDWNKDLRREIKRIAKRNPGISMEEVYVRAFETVKSHPHAPVLTTAEDVVPGTPKRLSSSNLLAEEVTSPPSRVASSDSGPRNIIKVGFAMGYYDCAEDVGKIRVPVTRSGDRSKALTLDVKGIDSTAVLGRDYQFGGMGTKLHFQPNAKTADVEITIISHGEYNPNTHFMLELSEGTDTVTETNIDDTTSVIFTMKTTKIRIVDAYEFKSCWDRIAKTITCTLKAIVSKESANHPYIEQIRCAIRGDEGNEEDEPEADPAQDSSANKVYELGDAEMQGATTSVSSNDDDGGTSCFGWFVYLYLVVFKVLLAIFSIPVSYGNGWGAFVSSLCWIAVWTALCGDLATGMGCTVGLADSVTAITFVAIGTSVPDTFASKIAAEEDETADPAIGNVTGSNAVNVFLGVGLSWLIGAVVQDVKYNRDFAVDAGSLAFAVVLFVALFVVWFTVLTVRRFVLGGELGGPKMSKYATIILFVSMWFFFIIMSSLVEYDIIDGI